MRKPPPITTPYAPDLAEVRAWLEKMIAALRFLDLVAAVIALIGRMRDINTELTKQLAQLRRKRPRSETLKRLERQLLLPLAGVFASAAPKPAADERTRTKKSRKGRHPGRGAMPSHLERVTVLNNVPPAMRVCPRCGSEMTTVDHSICRRLNVIPARVVVEERIDETVACPNDDTIVAAPAPPQIVERGVLGDTLIVEAVCDKYIEHQPVERQCTRFARAGVDVAPQTLGRSVAAAIDLLAPVFRSPVLDGIVSPLLDGHPRLTARGPRRWPLVRRVRAPGAMAIALRGARRRPDDGRGAPFQPVTWTTASLSTSFFFRRAASFMAAVATRSVSRSEPLACSWISATASTAKTSRSAPA